MSYSFVFSSLKISVKRKGGPENTSDDDRKKACSTSGQTVSEEQSIVMLQCGMLVACYLPQYRDELLE